MLRREFILGLAGVGAAWPLPGRAQETAQIRKIAVWLARADNLEGQRLITAFRQRLQVLGWAEGRNIRTDYRWVVGDSDRIRTIAKEIVEQQPEAILVESTPGVAAVSRESRTVPI